MPRLRTILACHRAAEAEFRRVPMPDLTPFDRGELLAARNHLASLPPERRAELERTWR